MQQQPTKPSTPPPPTKKCTIFFRKPLLTKNNFLKHTNSEPPPAKCALNKKTIFIGPKKSGQVIDLEVAKLLTLKWPKCGQVIDPTAHIYIHIHKILREHKEFQGKLRRHFQKLRFKFRFRIFGNFVQQKGDVNKPCSRFPCRPSSERSRCPQHVTSTICVLG